MSAVTNRVLGIATTRRRTRRRSVQVKDVVVVSLLVIASLFALYPFLWVVSIAFNQDTTFAVPTPFEIIPTNIGFENLSMVWESVDLGRLYANSLLICIGAVIISILSSVLSGYAISKMKFRGANVVLILALATMMLPGEATLIPNFLLMKDLGLLNSYWAIWLPQVVCPLGTFICKQFFDQIPDALGESAAIDGAGRFRIFFSVYLPLAVPAIATIAILEFLSNWNSLLWPLIVLNDPLLYNIQIGIQTLVSQRTEVPPGIISAAALFTALPMIVIYLLGQKYIIQSVANSGIKE